MSDGSQVPLDALAAAEKDLVQRVLDGDLMACNELYMRYRPIVFDIVSRRADWNDADDATQETFEHVFEHIKAFRAEGPLVAWIASIARNTGTWFARKSAAKRTFKNWIYSQIGFELENELNQPDDIFNPEDVPASRGLDLNSTGSKPCTSSHQSPDLNQLCPKSPLPPDEELERQEICRLVRIALNKLSERRRKCLELSEVEGRSIREIAEILGISDDSAEYSLKKAKRQFRIIFDAITRKHQ